MGKAKRKSTEKPENLKTKYSRKTLTNCDISNGDLSVSQESKSDPISGPSSTYNVCLSDFVVVEFYIVQTNSVRYFIGKVTAVNCDFYTVQFLQKHKSHFFWPDFIEHKHVLTTQVRGILSTPIEKNGNYLFNATELKKFNFN